MRRRWSTVHGFTATEKCSRAFTTEHADTLSSPGPIMKRDIAIPSVLVAAFLALHAPSSHATEFCVGSRQGLSQAFALAQGADDPIVIKLVQGTYSISGTALAHNYA